MKEHNRLLWLDKSPALYNSTYIGMFDLAKGLLMVQIILMHCINDHLAVNTLIRQQSVGVQLILSPLVLQQYGPVPMLFMICGFGIRRKSPQKCVKNSLKSFIFPYLAVIIAVLISVFVKCLLDGRSLIGRLVYQIVPLLLGLHPGIRFLGNSMEQIGPIWFFLVYTLGSIYLNFVLQEKESYRQLILVAAGSIIGLLTTGILLPFCIQQTFICSGFMFAGMHLKRNKILQKKLPIYLIIIGVAVCITASAVGGFAEFGNNIYLNGGVDLIIAYIAGFLLLYIYLRFNVLQGIIADALRWIGRHMMWICCFHTVTFLVIPWNRLSNYFGNQIFVNIAIEFIISLAFSLIGCVILNKVSRRFIKL